MSIQRTQPTRPRFLRFNTTEHMLFVRRLSLYLESGVPISEALHLLSEDTQSMSALYIFRQLVETVDSGLPLSQGLSLFPKQFDVFSIGFIHVGEVTGSLSVSLERLAIILSKRSGLRRKILSALAYPVLIFCGTVSIALFLTLFIFPKIVPVLQGFKTQLPFPTRVLIGINTFISHEWLVSLVMILIISIAIVLLCRYEKVRVACEYVLLRIPIFSKLYQYSSVALFSNTLSAQLKGGVRILSALALVRTSLPGTLYPKAISEIELQVAAGKRLSEALRQHQLLFPLLICQMIAAGEKTGTLASNLEYLAQMYEEHIDEVTKNLTVLIEPVLMVCMGIVVGFVALAIITPIYAVTQNLTIQ